MGEARSTGSIARPAPPLAGIVAWYQGYETEVVSPGFHRGLPAPYLTMIVTFDAPLVVAEHPDPTQPAGTYDTLIGGLHTRPALIAQSGRQAGIQLAIHPFGAEALFGMPAGELVGKDLDAVDVLGKHALELHERIQLAASWPERFAALDDVLSRRVRNGREPCPVLTHAWRRIVESRGTVRISSLADELGYSDRTLEKRFRAQTGLSPKVAARLARFDAARRALGHRALAGSDTSLAALAAEYGYYDQAHLAREFRELAGCPPTFLLRDEFENLQASAEVVSASSPA
ncbi:MAG TPA: helix-turn-helix domain-containing protein [Actinopolymorphaceae bacterium]|jgi:AraC-like DNA-binding protein